MSGKSEDFMKASLYDAAGFCTNALTAVSFFPVSDAEAAHSQLKKNKKTLIFLSKFCPDICGRIHIPAHPELRLDVKHMAPNTEETKEKTTRVTDENRMPPLPRFAIVSSAEQPSPRITSKANASSLCP